MFWDSKHLVLCERKVQRNCSWSVDLIVNYAFKHLGEMVQLTNVEWEFVRGIKRNLVEYFEMLSEVPFELHVQELVPIDHDHEFGVHIALHFERTELHHILVLIGLRFRFPEHSLLSVISSDFDHKFVEREFGDCEVFLFQSQVLETHGSGRAESPVVDYVNVVYDHSEDAALIKR